MITRTWSCAVHGELHRIVIDDESNGTELAAAAITSAAALRRSREGGTDGSSMSRARKPIVRREVRS